MEIKEGQYYFINMKNEIIRYTMYMNSKRFFLGTERQLIKLLDEYEL